ncbi:MAG TPA: general secretion pathway protein GspB [Gammaproteobacteria bacterium]
MSDILDALRKAELQRSASPVPGISTRQRYRSASARRHWPSPLLLIGALVLGASVTGGVAYLALDTQVPVPVAEASAKPVVPAKAVVMPPPQTPTPSTAQAVIPPSQANSPRPTPPGSRVVADPQVTATGSGSEEGEEEESTPLPPPESAPQKRPPAVPPDIAETEVAANSAAPVQNTQKSVPHPSSAHSERTAYNHVPMASNPLNLIRPPVAVEVQEFQPKLPSSAAARKPRATGAATTSNEPLLTTLSYQFQTMVPKMSINAQVYSKQPAERFVVINMKRYIEGQQTVDGVKVEAIRQADIVFSYQGQRFRLDR